MFNRSKVKTILLLVNFYLLILQIIYDFHLLSIAIIMLAIMGIFI